MFSLISARELKERLSSTVHKPIVVDARRRYEFNSGHIPGAAILRWEKYCEPAPSASSTVLHQPGWWGKLAESSPKVVAKKLEQSGLGSQQHIVVYADGAKSKGRDGRIAWMLLYFGAREVSLLNGGWSAWLDSGGDIELEITPPQAGHFVVDIDEQRRVLLEDIVQRPQFFAVDTRTQKEYRGEIYDYQPRLGRIPNSINVPFSRLYDESNKFLNKDSFELLILEQSSGNKHESNFDFSYCEVGVRAATFSLLHELYLGRKLPVYDGSFMEWSFDERLTVIR